MINLLDIIFEDFINYKKISMLLSFPKCNMKCNKEANKIVCHNYNLLQFKSKIYSIDDIIEKYINNDITEAIVMQGLEPLDSFNELIEFIKRFRKRSNDDIVIYTGYNKYEIEYIIEELKKYSNIIIKYGRYIPDQENHYDEILGVNLASDNQYAEKIS